MQSIGSRARYFDRPYELSLLLGCSPGPQFEAEVCARGWALVLALRPADFVGIVGEGDAACDVYHLEASGRANGQAQGHPDADRRRLRIALTPYEFAGQPRLLFIAIAALPESFAQPEPPFRLD